MSFPSFYKKNEQVFKKTGSNFWPPIQAHTAPPGALLLLPLPNDPVVVQTCEAMPYIVRKCQLKMSCGFTSFFERFLSHSSDAVLLFSQGAISVSQFSRDVGMGALHEFSHTAGHEMWERLSLISHSQNATLRLSISESHRISTSMGDSRLLLSDPLLLLQILQCLSPVFFQGLPCHSIHSTSFTA